MSKLKPFSHASLHSLVPAPPHRHTTKLKVQYRACATMPCWPWDPTNMPSFSAVTVSHTLHHANVTKRPLVLNWILFGPWRVGKEDTWLPAPVDVNVSLDYLLFVGQGIVEGKQTSFADQEVIQLLDQSKRAGSAMSFYRNQNQVRFPFSRGATIFIWGNHAKNEPGHISYAAGWSSSW